MVARAAAWVGLLGYMIGQQIILYDDHCILKLGLGLTSFLIDRMWMGKAVDDFNVQVAQMGSSGPQIQANLSNGFTSKFLAFTFTSFLRLLPPVLWVAYAFGAVPLVCVIMKIHHASIPVSVGKS